MNFKEYINEYDYGVLDESGAGIKRVMSKLEENKDFIMITAFRQKYGAKENKKRNNQLIKDIRSALGEKAGAYKMVGHWKECSEPLKDGETIKDCKGKIENALEETWLIMKPDSVPSDKFDKTAQKMARKYDQDAYVIRQDGEVYLKGKDGSKWADLGKANEKSLKKGFAAVADIQGYSELKKDRVHGRVNNIVFESFGIMVPKDTNSSKMLFKYAGFLY
jgi:hypothetical protein